MIIIIQIIKKTTFPLDVGAAGLTRSETRYARELLEILLSKLVFLD